MTTQPKAPATRAAAAVARAESGPASLATAPSGYADWLADVKAPVHAAQQRATLAVNHDRLLRPGRVTSEIAHDHRSTARLEVATPVDAVAFDLTAA